MTQRFEVRPDDVGARLDALVARLAGVSRARAAAAITAGAVRVDGAAARRSLRIQEGMRVEVGDMPADEGGAAPTPEDIPLRIVFEDEHLLVVSKPAGLVVHPAPGHPSGTLVNALLHRAAPRGGDPRRPGIVHRLDAGTSGLMIVSKDERVHERLTRMMSARDIHRTYRALVEGVPRTDLITVDAPVGRDPRHRTRMAVVASGRPAVTRAEVVERFEAAALLDVRPETGRTHQIRVHLSAAGHPIAGDPTYGGSRRLAEHLGLARPFLHAGALAFVHPVTGAPLALEDPLPEDLRRALERCRVSTSRAAFRAP